MMQQWQVQIKKCWPKCHFKFLKPDSLVFVLQSEEYCCDAFRVYPDATFEGSNYLYEYYGPSGFLGNTITSDNSSMHIRWTADSGYYKKGWKVGFF